MKITKFGHSCLLVEEGDARILIDPGSYSNLPDQIDHLDAIILTHLHQDHIDIAKLKKIVEENPRARIFSNQEVATSLAKEGVEVDLLEAGGQAVVQNVVVEGFGSKHAVIHESIPVIANTGYIIAGKLFYPGDALTIPDLSVAILALPVAAPWMKVGETIDYIAAIKPKIVFPVHDAIVTANGPYHRLTKQAAESIGAEWLALENGMVCEIPAC